MTNEGKVWLVPGSCDLTKMHPNSRSGFKCHQWGNQSVVPVQAGFGGWGMYSTHLFLNFGCRHDLAGGACEHDSLNQCISSKGGEILIATDLVINWEGCGS